MKPRPLQTGECIIRYDHPIGGSVYDYVCLKYGNSMIFKPIDYNKWKDVLRECDIESFSWVQDDPDSAAGKIRMYGKAYCMKGYSFRDDFNKNNLFGSC